MAFPEHFIANPPPFELPAGFKVGKWSKADAFHAFVLRVRVTYAGEGLDADVALAEGMSASVARDAIYDGLIEAVAGLRRRHLIIP